MIIGKKNKYWVWLSLIKDLGSRKKQKKLLEIYKTPENIYKLNKKRINKCKRNRRKNSR